MKKFILITFIIFGCTTSSRKEWDSGGASTQMYQQQRMEENSENVQNQFPSSGPGTERNQPF